MTTITVTSIETAVVPFLPRLSNLDHPFRVLGPMIAPGRPPRPPTPGFAPPQRNPTPHTDADRRVRVLDLHQVGYRPPRTIPAPSAGAAIAVSAPGQGPAAAGRDNSTAAFDARRAGKTRGGQRRVHINEIATLKSKAAVLTEEEGTISGELDLSLDDANHGLVRYRGTDKWYRIGNLDAEPPRTWADLPALVGAVEEALGERDFAGNAIPFEAPAGTTDDSAAGASPEESQDSSLGDDADTEESVDAAAATATGHLRVRRCGGKRIGDRCRESGKGS